MAGTRQLNWMKQPMWYKRLVLGSVAPVRPPLHIKPTATPSGTAVEGDVHWNDTANGLKFYDGTGHRTIPGIEAAQTWTGVQTFSVAPVFSVGATSTLPGTGPMPRRPVKTAAATLTAADNGALCVFASAAGDIYTLPAPQVGLWFDFQINTTITSNAAKVITDAGTTFLIGTFRQSTDGTYVTADQTANGSTHVAITMNGTTTGGYTGDWWRVTCISTTLWAISGFGRATGSEATPFATS